MPVHHRILIMALLLVVGVTGTFALADSVRLGPDAKPVTLTPQEITARSAAVRASERSIRAALGAPVPALPQAPRFSPLGEPRLGPLVVFRVLPASPARKAPSKPARPRVKKKTTKPTPATPPPAPTPTTTTPPPTPPVKRPKCEVHDDGLVECQAPEGR